MLDVSITPLVGSGVDLATYAEEGFGRRVLGANERIAIVLAAFHPGQEIPAHDPAVDLVLAVLSGDGELWAGPETHRIRAGDLAVVPAGDTRAVRAGPSGMVALHVVSPPPTPEDHATFRTGTTWPEPGGNGKAVAAEISREHGGLRPRLEELADLADRIKGLDADERRHVAEETLTFLRSELLPHAVAEENAVYPAAERVLRARGGAVRAMTLEHEAIADLVDELERAARTDDPTALPRILHSLRAITLLHLDEEEHVYLPALAGLSTAEVEELRDRLDHH